MKMDSLYRIVLGTDFDRLPPVLQRVHDGAGCALEGGLRVRWSSRRWMRALLCFSLLPRPAGNAPCRASIAPDEKGELWHRRIGNRLFASRMGMGFRIDSKACRRRHNEHLIVERMGPLALYLDTNAMPDGTIVQRSRKATLFGLPFPCAVVTRERAVDERRYRCDVRIWIHGLGYLLRYDGVLGLAGEEESLPGNFSSNGRRDE